MVGRAGKSWYHGHRLRAPMHARLQASRGAMDGVLAEADARMRALGVVRKAGA